MRFLDLDLDFFLNEDAFCVDADGKRQGTDYQVWSISRVRHFLENRCGLSRNPPLRGRTVKTHDGVLDFWHMLIESGNLAIPFDVIHIDAHPDLWIGGAMHLTSGVLHYDPEYDMETLRKKEIHQGNYLTHAIAHGWIRSLIWIPLLKHVKRLPKWNGDARLYANQFSGRKTDSLDVLNYEKKEGIPFSILSWNKFRTSEPFDYIALSKSPAFTPPESDELIAIIEKYISQI